MRVLGGPPQVPRGPTVVPEIAGDIVSDCALPPAVARHRKLGLNVVDVVVPSGTVVSLPSVGSRQSTIDIRTSTNDKG